MRQAAWYGEAARQTRAGTLQLQRHGAAATKVNFLPILSCLYRCTDNSEDCQFCPCTFYPAPPYTLPRHGAIPSGDILYITTACFI